MNARELIKKLNDKKGFFSVEWFAENLDISKENAKEILDFGVSLGIFYITLDKQRWDLKEYALHEIIPKQAEEEFQEFLNKFYKDMEIVEVSVQPEMFFPERAFVPKILGDLIMEKFAFKTVKGNDKQIYCYKEGYYQENGIALIKAEATRYLDTLFKECHANETVSYIRNSTYINADEINHNWINLKNGLFNPLTKEFQAHTPEIFCMHQLPYSYDPRADCPLWKEKLKEKCDEDWKYDLTQEMFGYSFLKDQRFEKAFLLYGQKETGKSTTLDVQANCLGKDNYEAMSLQHMTEDYTRAPAYLYGKFANICPDLTPKELKNDSIFLRITGQDPITAGKKYEHQITFHPYSKLIFSCNVIPGTKNKNDAFYRRWCIIEFKIPHKARDVLLREKFYQELPGIFNWAIEGLDRILETNKLSYPLTIEQTKELYEKGSDSVNSFIYEYIDTEDDEGAIKKRDVYKKYKEYCKENKLNIENDVWFGRRFYSITGCGTRRIGTIPAYSGIKFKEAKEEQPKI